jgi:DNA-binding MarR family transcriptional regulator
MQQFAIRTESDANSETCAALLVEVVPLLMRALRAEMRSRGEGLAVPQFRTLAFLNRRPGASLSEVAENLGLSLASTSKKVDGLVDRKLVCRASSTDDRRRVTLDLSAEGHALFAAARQGTRESFAESLAGLSAADRLAVARALRLLRTAFAPDDAGSDPPPEDLAPDQQHAADRREDEQTCN